MARKGLLCQRERLLCAAVSACKFICATTSHVLRPPLRKPFPAGIYVGGLGTRLQREAQLFINVMFGVFLQTCEHTMTVNIMAKLFNFMMAICFICEQ